MEDHIDSLISAFIDHELDPADRQMAERHLQSCERCSQLVAELERQQSEITAFFQSVNIPESLGNRVLGGINSMSPTQSWIYSIGTMFILIAAAILVYGSLGFKLASAFSKMAFGALYTVLHIIGNQPAILLSSVLFAAILLTISVYSLRILLKADLREGDESFG